MTTALKIPTRTKEDLRPFLSNLLSFTAVCLPHYMTMTSAPFHMDLCEALESDEHPLLEIIGFRSSAKTTFASLSFPLKSALSGKYKFIVIINDTGEQVAGNLHNIKTELENNQVIKIMYPHVRLGHTWSKFNLILEVRKPDGTFDEVRIIGRSRGQNIRGIRHKQTRPDLIILDDPENTLQVRTKENRDATENWFRSEVVPAAQESNSKLIVIGNLVHNDGFMARLAKNPLFHVIRIPFYNEKGYVQWKAKYPTQEAIDRQRTKVGEASWSREYLLKIIAEDDQIIKETDIQRYPNKILTERDEKGNLKLKIKDAGAGVDLAISEKETADYTAVVSGLKVDFTGDKILIRPAPVKKRMNFDATISEVVGVKNELPHGAKFFVEDVGYQRVAIQTLRRKGVVTFPMRPITDKRARLQSIAMFIKNGTVLFPETGCEDLIQSLINFGIEAHDDDVDALVYLILGLINKPTARVVSRIDKL